jgi:uncharacterized protein DUF4232
MPRDRATSLLDEFAAVTAAAPRPAPAARPAAVRSGLPIGTLIGGALVVAAIAVAGFLAGRPAPIDDAAASPSVTALPSSTALPSAAVIVATPGPSSSTCQLTARIDHWEGAAGQRIAAVELINGDANECRMERLPRVQLVDGGGNVLIDSGASASNAVMTLSPGGRATTEVAVGNWCGPLPQAPISVAFAFSSGDRLVAAPVSPTDRTLPPCNGEGAPATISMHPWSS